MDGEVAGAIRTLEALEAAAQYDGLKLQEVAGTYLQCGQHAGAARCHARAVELQPSNPDFLYNLATSRSAFGQLDEAERLFTRAIELNPRDYGAWLNRSILRRRSPEDNHVSALQALLPLVEIQAASPVYETPPWGYTDQPAFLNQVIHASTALLPLDLLGFQIIFGWSVSWADSWNTAVVTISGMVGRRRYIWGAQI